MVKDTLWKGYKHSMVRMMNAMTLWLKGDINCDKSDKCYTKNMLKVLDVVSRVIVLCYKCKL